MLIANSNSGIAIHVLATCCFDAYFTSILDIQGLFWIDEIQKRPTSGVNRRFGYKRV